MHLFHKRLGVAIDKRDVMINLNILLLNVLLCNDKARFATVIINENGNNDDENGSDDQNTNSSDANSKTMTVKKLDDGDMLLIQYCFQP